MAEERMIDEDKDKNKKGKYFIRVNEDGEEELVIEEREEEAQEEIVSFAEEDDEEAATLTPEQYAEKRRILAEAEAAENNRFAELKDKVKEALKLKDFETAKYDLEQAEEVKTDGEFYCLKMRTLSREFKDFSALKECEEVAPFIKDEASAEQKAELKNLSSEYEKKLKELKASSEKLGSELEEKRAERRVLFGAIRKSALIFLLSSAVPFAIFLITGIILAFTVMFSAENGSMLILTIVFFAFAGVMLIVTAIAARKFWAAASNYSANERNSTSELGRRYDEENKALTTLTNILSAFENDIS